MGFGGYEAYTWACEYPDEMEFLIIGYSSFKTNGYCYIISKIIDAIILSLSHKDKIEKLTFFIFDAKYFTFSDDLSKSF